MRAHLKYLKLLGHHALRHADTSSNWMTVAGILLLAVGLGGVINGMAEVVPGGGIYTLAGFGGLYMVGKSVWDADQASIAELQAAAAKVTGTKQPAEALAELAHSAVILNDHPTNYSEVLRLVWQKLAHGATEAVVEHDLHVAFPQPEGQEKRYHLVANPDLDFFFGRMRLLQAVEIVTVRVPASPYVRLFPTNPATIRPGAVAPQEVIGPTDEQRYMLTQFGCRIVELLASSPTPDTGENLS